MPDVAPSSVALEPNAPETASFEDAPPKGALFEVRGEVGGPHPYALPPYGYRPSMQYKEEETHLPNKFRTALADDPLFFNQSYPTDSHNRESLQNVTLSLHDSPIHKVSRKVAQCYLTLTLRWAELMRRCMREFQKKR